MKFIYKARNKAGKIETGVIESNSRDSAALLLQKYGVFVTYLEEQQTDKVSFANMRIERKTSKKDLVIFFRQLAVMLESQVPVVQSLDSLALQTKKLKFKAIIQEISKSVQEGIPLSGAMANYPKVFDNLYVSLIKSGEVSGNIAGALRYLSEHLERENDINAQLKQAMVYPIFVITVLFIVLGIIIIGVMPRIVNLIEETGTDPSLSTKMILNFYKFLSNYWWAILLCIIFCIMLVVYYFRTKDGKEFFDRTSLTLPFIGTFLKKVFLTRFCANISTLMTSGVSINNALNVAKETTNNVAYKEIIFQIGKDVSEGNKMSISMSKSEDFFPPFVVQMIKVGEETGKLDQTMVEVVNFYQKDIKRSIDLFSSLLEPIMIIFLGGIVGMLAFSVLQPIYGSLANIG